MQLTIIQVNNSPVIGEFMERMEAFNLQYYASDAATEMGFDSLEELHNSVKRAMELCLSSGISIKGNFQRVYKSFDDGLIYDWKLSLLAYKLVCASGNSTNPKVAKLIIQLIKDQHLNHF
jgi:hypothetical protein